MPIDLAAALPDPGAPTVIPFAAVSGAFLGAAYARARGGDREALRRSAEDAGFAATALAMLLYLFGLLTGVY